MIKKINLLILLVLVHFIGIGQNIQDSTMCFPVWEVRTAIKKMNYADEAKSIILFREIEIKNLSEIINQNQQLIKLEEQKNINLHVVILEKDKQIIELQKNYKKLENKFRIRKIVSNVILSGLAVTTGYLFFKKEMEH